MVKIIISEGKTAQKTLRKGMNLLKDTMKEISKVETILILIDFQIPKGCPVTVNPDTIGELISICKNNDTKKILILPGTIKEILPLQALKFVGLDEYIRQKGGEPINHDQLEEYKNKIDFFIVLSQVRTDPTIGLRTSFPLLFFANPPNKRDIYVKKGEKINRTSQKNNEYMGNWLNKSFNVLDWKYPSLYINDSFQVLEGNGPYSWMKPKIKSIHKIFLSNDITALDITTLKEFGYNTDENPFIKRARKLKILPEKMDIIKTESITKTITKNHKLKLPENNPKNIKIFGLTLYLGDLEIGLKNALLQFLYLLEAIFYKDSFNLGEWIIISGKNPPEPKITGKERIIVFGDSTIKETVNYKFRTISSDALTESYNVMGFPIGKKKIFKGEKLERAIISNQTKIRQKVNKIREEINDYIENLAENEDSIYQKRSKLQKEYKNKLKIARYQKKIEMCRVKLTAKHKILVIKNKKPSLILNRRVLDVPGNPPIGWNALTAINQLWKPYYIPTLDLFIKIYQKIYNFPKYDKSLEKEHWKSLKKDLKVKLKDLYKNIDPEINKEINVVKTNKKNKANQIKNDYIQAKNRIKRKYKSKIKPLRNKIIEIKKQKTKDYLNKLKKNIQNVFKKKDSNKNKENLKENLKENPKENNKFRRLEKSNNPSLGGEKNNG